MRESYSKRPPQRKDRPPKARGRRRAILLGSFQKTRTGAEGSRSSKHALLLCDDDRISWLRARALNPGNLGIRKDTADQYERRGHIVEVKVAEVRYALASAEHAERAAKVNIRKQDKRDLGAIQDIPKPEARQNIVELERPQVANGNTPASDNNATAGKIRPGPKREPNTAIYQSYHSFYQDKTVYSSCFERYKTIAAGKEFVFLFNPKKAGRRRIDSRKRSALHG